MNTFIKRIASFSQNRFYLLGLSLLAGLLLGLAWYEPLTFLIFIALIPLLAIENYVSNTNTLKNPIRTLFAYTYLAFLVWNVIVTYWLTHASWGGAAFSFFMNSFLQTLPIIAYHFIKKKANNQFGYALLFINWLAFEYIHFHWALSFPWLNIGNVFGAVPSWVQWYEYTGILGGTLWVCLVNFFIFQALKTHYGQIQASDLRSDLTLASDLSEKSNRRSDVKISAFFNPAFFLFFPLIFSFYQFYTFEEKGKTAEIAVIQPNIDCYGEKYSYNPRSDQRNNPNYIPYDQQVDRHLKLTDSILTPQTLLVAFPETALHEVLEERNPKNDVFIQKLHLFLEKYPNTSLITGVNAYKRYETMPDLPTVRNHNGMIYEIFNSAYFIDPKSRSEFYHKSQLVLGVETNPLAGAMKFLDGYFMLDLGGMVGNLGRQAEREVFDNGAGLRSAPVICYESVYGEFVGEYVQKGANVLIIITNDGWWDETAGYKQHLKFSPLRAIETRRNIARSANTGVSCFINSRGEIGKFAEYGTQTALLEKVRLSEEKTFYVEHGDYLGRWSGFLAVFLFLVGLVKGKVWQKK